LDTRFLVNRSPLKALRGFQRGSRPNPVSFRDDPSGFQELPVKQTCGIAASDERSKAHRIQEATMPQVTLHSEHAEVYIRVESAPRSVPNVFALATRIQKRARRLFTTLCRAWLQVRLAEDLGPRYTRGQAFPEGDLQESPQAPPPGTLQCPECGSRRARHKSWRSRQVAVPRWGKTTVERPCLRCRDCGRS
jgi:hypothetical protein